METVQVTLLRTGTVTRVFVLRLLLGDPSSLPVHHIAIISPYPSVHRLTETQMFSVDDEKRWSIAAASALPADCSMLAVLSLIRRRVCGTTRLPADEAHRADHAGMSATDVNKSNIYSGECRRSHLWTSKHNLNCILSMTGSQCNC